MHKKLVLFLVYPHYPHFFLQVVEKIFTLKPVHFKGKSSYTPTYPHYPQLFAVYQRLSPSEVQHSHFCIDLINFNISTKNTIPSLDKNMRMICSKIKNLQCLISSRSANTFISIITMRNNILESLQRIYNNCLGNFTFPVEFTK